VAKLPGVDYIFIRYGGNDFAKRDDFLVNFPKDYRELLARLRSDHPRAALIPTTNIPWGVDLEAEGTWPKISNKIIQQVAAEEKLVCFDLYPRYAAEQAKGPNMLNYLGSDRRRKRSTTAKAARRSQSVQTILTCLPACLL
jgi:lysophospholipase L1-like esterase